MSSGRKLFLVGFAALALAFRAESDDSGCWHARSSTVKGQRNDLSGCIGVFDLF